MYKKYTFVSSYQIKNSMERNELTRELVLQLLKSRMIFRQTIQRILKRNNIDMTFEMLQVMSLLWHEQGISQQKLAEKSAKDKACMTSLMNNLEKKGWVVRMENPSDRRNRLIYVTPEGAKMKKCVYPLIWDVYNQAGTEMGTEVISACITQLKSLDEILNRL